MLACRCWWGVWRTPAHYRHFAVKTAAGGDDYAGMAEIIRRRFAGGVALGEKPDLVLIDGGRGQVEAARQALQALGVHGVPLVGLAKARTKGAERTDERLVREDLDEPIVLEPDDPALRILVKARDEAHRFAGRYQRKRRARAFGHGALDGIPGVGPSRKKRLLQQFGSVEALRNAPFEDLAAVPGHRRAAGAAHPRALGLAPNSAVHRALSPSPDTAEWCSDQLHALQPEVAGQT